MIKSKFYIFFFLFCSFIVKAQTNFIETKNKITTFKVSNDEKYVAFTSDKKIYWASIDQMKLLDSFALAVHEDYYVSAIDILPNNNVLVLKQKPLFEKRSFTYDFLEYPQDSIHLFNLAERKITNSVPGNNHIQFLYNQENKLIVSYNDYFKYQDSYGQTNYSPLKGKITLYPSELTIDAPGVIRHLLTHPTKKEVVLVYFYKDENKNRQYVFEVRSSETLEVIRKKQIELVDIESVSCSSDGSVWNFIVNESYSKTSNHFFNYDTLDEISTVDANTKFPGWMLENKIVRLDDNSIKTFNAKTLEPEEEIWANLTKFNSFTGFYSLNATTILILGEKSNYSNHTKNGIQKFSLLQEEIYTKKQKVDENEIIFDPNIALLATNTVKDESQNVSFYEDWMVVHFDSSVEFWNIPKQKKWRTFSFSKKAYTHFSEKTMQLLVFEESTGKSFDDFVMRVIDLRTGVIHSKLFADNKYRFINPLGGSYTFIPTDNPNQWIGRDYQALWLVDTDKMECNALHQFEKKLFPDKLVGIKNNQLLLSLTESVESDNGFSKYIKKGYYWFDLKNSQLEKITDSENWLNVHLLANKELAFTTKNEFFSIKNTQKNKIKDITLSDKSSFLTDKGLWIETNKGFSTIDYNGTEKNVAIDGVISYKGFGANSTNAFVKTSEELFTYDSKSDYLNAWRISKTKKLFYPESEIQIHPSGQVLWRNKLLINLNTLSSEKKYDLSEEAYLFDKLPYVIRKKFNKETQSFHWFIEQFDESSKEIWMSSPLKTEDIYFRVSNFMFSETENQMLGYQSGYFGTSAVDYFFWADWKKNVSKTITTKKNILTINKTNDSAIVQVVFVENESQYFNIVSGGWEKNFEKKAIHKNQPSVALASQQVEWIDKKGENKNFYSREYLKSSLYSKKLEKLFAGSDNGKVFVWDLDNSTPIEIIKTGTTEPIVRIIEKDNQLIAVDNYGSLHFIDNKTYKWILTIAVQEYEENKYSVLWYTPEGFYSAEKSALRDFHFIKQEKVLPLTIFDAYLNRPEKILEKLANKDTTFLNLYKEATQKRMKKMGISETIDFWNMQRPEVTFDKNYQPSLTTEKLSIDIPLHFSENAKTFEVYDNGVLLTKKDNYAKKDDKINVVLHAGENNISIIAKDKNLIESDPLSFKIINKNEVKPMTYYIGIGVSTYQDSTMNLKFAVKDIEKLEEYFTERYRDDTIKTFKLLNKDVTVENIKKIKDILNKTNVNDRVVISFSGHGLINNEKEFYFAGYDTDFSSPEKAGISYELIQSLTDNIPARKRLILIDACHSGSLDEDEKLSVSNDPNVKEHDIKGSIVVKGSKSQTLDSFEQMQNLFFDLNKSNGTIIIAAAGGKEYAYEGKDWNNGVFTYSLIKTLEEMGYDTWKGDVGVPVSTLQKEVYKKVRNLTNGKQKPTARSENPEWDWKL